MVVGQKKLVDKLNSFTLDTIPRAMLFLGEKGSGKDIIIREFSHKHNLELIDITELISWEYIDELYRKSIPAMYLIDSTKIVEKEQNLILKLLEEPLKNSYIIVTAYNRTNVLNTIYNRCQVFELQPYTKEELEHFLTSDTNKDLMLTLCRTPGMIRNTNPETIKDLDDLTKKIVSSLSRANYANTLTIANKINFKDEFDKFDINLFFDTLIYNLYKKYLENNDKILYNMYMKTVNDRKKLIDARLNKEQFIENFLTSI